MKPLSGITVVNTRAKDQAAEFTGALRELGADVLEFPTIRIASPPDREPILNALRNIAIYDWIILTSANGAQAFADAAAECGVGAGSFGKAKICAVGASTAQRIRSLGLPIDLVPEEFTAENLVQHLMRIERLEGRRILFPRGDLARTVIVESLRKAGASVEDVVVYVNVPETPDEEAIRRLFEPRAADVITFTSSSTAKNFAAALGEERLRALCGKTLFASIGPVTSGTMRALGIPVSAEADPHDLPGLVAAVLASRK